MTPATTTTHLFASLTGVSSWFCLDRAGIARSPGGPNHAGTFASRSVTCPHCIDRMRLDGGYALPEGQQDQCDQCGAAGEVTVTEAGDFCSCGAEVTT